MKHNTAYKGRTVPNLHDLLSCTIKSEFSSHCTLYLSISYLALATFTCGCSKYIEDISENPSSAETKLTIEWDNDFTSNSLEVIDIFTFNEDSLGHLDSYQRIHGIKNNQATITTTGGRKKVVICSNLCLPTDEISRISTLNDLEKTSCMLEDIKRSRPFMIGTAIADIDKAEPLIIRLKPMASEIVLRSIRCCFTGTPYEGEHITDAKVYLINVNAQCCLSESEQTTHRFINIGMLNHNEVSAFQEQELIIQTIGEDISESVMYTEISLLCFHNHCEEESPGSPFTRMVIEGRIQGTTYYWPITINRTDEGKGVRNNTRHVFDLTIRRKGSMNPDEELSIEDFTTMMEIEEWKEKNGYVVRF